MPARKRVAIQIRTIIGAVVVSVMALAALGFYAVSRVDQDSLDRQNHLAFNALAAERADFRRQQQIATATPEAWIFARSNNQSWLDRNLGTRLSTDFGHDRIYIVDAQGKPIYGMENGTRLEPSQIHVPPAIAVSIHNAQQGALRSATVSRPIAADTIMLDGLPAMVSIVTMAPNWTNTRPTPRASFLHVSVKYLDAELIKRMGDQFRLNSSHFERVGDHDPEHSRIPIVSSNNTLLGYIAWDPIKPASSLINHLMPALTAVAAVIALVLAFLLYRFRRATLQLQESESGAQHLALHDPLTDLPNRTLFNDRLRLALLSLADGKTKTALLYLDLDHFKHINDTLGHPTGDELVRQVARRLEALVRKHDTVARLGGDEFGIVLERINDICVITRVAERLVASMARPFDLSGEIVHIGASVGVVVAPDAGADAEDLRRKADIALYEAKKNGRSRYQMFTAGMDELLVRRRRIESELRSALQTGEGLALAFQPIMAADGRTILGAEALTRWHHPIHGAIPTAQFVSIAEQRGLIGELGSWVAKSAIAFLATSNLPWVAINVSPSELRDPDFANQLLALLADHDVSPSRLQVEITEGVLLEGKRAVSTVLRTLHNAGVAIALDDFGTGYSSLGYLRRHTIDKLKIDRTFIRELGRSPEDDAIVKAVIDLAKALKLKVTAEGVETKTQFARTVDLGCLEFQGFLFSEPLPAEELRRTFDHPAPRLVVDRLA
ncbi:putative bifunctional diguanylate cyclase/phosphodiesterase [Tianweitania populi]|uniref:Bifunctional diguanylate cyclase/phosphodiesterase n=1 Tax=Tianweitania populi TaxID=1607949 RepID=A0A8J3GKB6_9HYPH|nr:EAL domain-containing protein [Tianweitania populi]GHD11987.1 bifunctional diguanylate cyclase/phosphodiesterase [Tianweitania populi]